MAAILVADDDEFVTEVICETLRGEGHFVGTLNDGLHVIDVVKTQRPDLVILDCSMPGLSGVDALRQIRSSEDCYAVPVLMLTGRASSGDETIALRAGADHYMRKPFDLDELIAVAELLLETAAYRSSRAFIAKPSKVAEALPPAIFE